jgi:mRNA deadenylase 3'-5' endonuclease subunit Ccr4
MSGYKGEFKKRTRSMQDGCATFYKTAVFDCESTVPIEYLKPGVPALDRDNVALLLLLRPKFVQNTSTRLCVANTHLLFNPRRGDIKLAQLMLLFAEIDRLAHRYDMSLPVGNVPVYHPILFCGDLNMEPFSQLYRFVSSGLLPVDGVTVRKLSGSASFLDSKLGISDASQYIEVCRQRAKSRRSAVGQSEADADDSEREDESDYVQGTGVLTHRLGFRSVYRHFTEYGKRQYKHIVPEVSTSHSRANCTVDYIFYSSGVADTSGPFYDADMEIKSSSDSDSSGSSSGDELAADNAPSPNVEMKSPVAERGASADSRSSGGASTSQGIGSHDDRLQLLGHLALLSDREMKQIGGLPNELISSDHLILSAKFALKVDQP